MLYSCYTPTHAVASAFSMTDGSNVTVRPICVSDITWLKFRYSARKPCVLRLT